ncbi:FAD-binding oxidoreductase [Peribacillus glennii]|uniref:D-lactate dehydrogenase (cytochrome) n=1 Tax=Peribacillus glennii TaxID=2303991 RepID=A0A372LH81_9BACI|nr:FAD-linked oxidase C-terminal domain-containing protein [Peribacillus glennii]RFU65302.1 FAD-binding protein [Peribacillus glennii]
MLYQELLEIINDRERVSINETVLEQHSKGLTYHTGKLPDVVVFPTTEEEVVEVVKYAAANKIPIVPFGAGSSLEGHVIPLKGGISLDFTLMNKVVSVHPEDFLVKVQPGVTRKQLNLHLKKHGLFFPVDPGADATIGGMAATNASGTSAVAYGTMKRNVLGLRAVLANGDLVSTGGETIKSSAGYNLTELFVGSEGTLGVFTEITLKLSGIPEETIAAKAYFTDVVAAGSAAEMVLQSGVRIGKIELVDPKTIEAVNHYKGTSYQERPTLFLEYSGSKEEVDNGITFIEQLMEEAGCLEFEYERDSLKRAQLWDARHSAAIAVVSIRPNQLLVSTDVCVPISELAKAISYSREVIEKYRIDAALVGHVGDGNFHALFGVNPNDLEEMERFHNMNNEIVDYALQHRGTCTGEHGIGIGKMKFLEKEKASSLHIMKAIKATLDPDNILNPGKVFIRNEVEEYL